MLRLTKQADYGLVLLSHFVAHGREAVHSARDLAAETGLPLPTVGNVLKLLARTGILSSQRGVNGGYALTVEPHQISVADVVQALEGPIGMTDCAPGASRSCEHEPHCMVRTPMQRINAAIRETLSKMTLAELGSTTTTSTPQ